MAEAWQQLLRHSVASDDGTIFKKLSREEIASILQWMPVVCQTGGQNNAFFRSQIYELRQLP